ncbi:MAG: hypothetical protein H6834_07070 [Planctomycetes bacterium]|nr:hypothetical protein [Planctomycetota bacterium]MCB9891568.1 hypothetical protein [Planctomycetota bacterium]
MAGLLTLALGSCLQLPQDTGALDDPRRPAWLLQRVERLRGLGRDGAWDVRLETQEDMDRVFADALQRDYDAETLGALEETYRAFGFLGEDEGLAVALAASMAAEGYVVYDSTTGRLHVLDQLLQAGQADFAITFHGNEAVEDARFRIGERRAEAQRLGRDAVLALASLVKGSAYNLVYEVPFDGDFTDSLIGLRARMPGAVTPSQVPNSAAVLGSSLDRARAEYLLDRGRDLRDLLMFPHTHGRAFVRELRERYGWAMVDHALAHPPTSTEQILHPEKFHQHRDDPVAIELASDAFTFDEVRTTHEGTLGEFAISLWLRAATDAAEEVAAGWGGDRYRVVVDADAGRHVFWHTVWDTEADANAFLEVVRDVVAVRYGSETAVRAERVDPTEVILAFGPDAARLEHALARMRAGDRKVLPEAHHVDEFVWTDVLVLPARALVDVTDGDHATDVDLLGGLLVSTSFTRFGGRVELLKGGLLSYENSDERFRFALLFGLLSYHRRARGDGGFLSLFPLLESGWRADGSATGFALDLVGFANAAGHERWSTGLVGRAVTSEVTIDEHLELASGEPIGEDLSFLFGLVTTGHREGEGAGGAHVRQGSSTLLGSLVFASIDRRILELGDGIDVEFQEWSIGTPLLVRRSYRRARSPERDAAAERELTLLGGLLYSNWERGPHESITTPLVGWRHDATGRYVTFLFGLLPIRLGEGDPRPVPIERPRGF